MEFDELRRGVETDPETAFQVGCRLLASPDYDAHVHAEQAFQLAARTGGPDMPWRIADAYIRAWDARAATWYRRGVASLDDSDGIRIDPGVLPIRTLDGGDREVLTDQDWQLSVESDDDARARAALTAAEPRLYRVLDDGRELSAAEFDTWLHADRGPNGYNPNWVHVPADADPPRVVLDCKSSVMPLMARTVLRVVTEELRTAGISRALLYTDEPTG